MINPLKELRVASFGLFVATLVALNTPGQTTATTDPIGYIARAATYLVAGPLTTPQVQTLNAQNFYDLPALLRPLYLHAVAFQIGHIVSVGEPLPASALAEYLETADINEFFDIFAVLPHDDAMLIKEALREVSALFANEIAANLAYQRAIQSGTVNGFTFPDGGGTGSLLLPTSGSAESLNNLDDWNEFHVTDGGTSSLVGDILADL